MRDYGLKGSVFADELYCTVRTDFRDGIDVVAAEEDAEVDKLGLTISCWPGFSQDQLSNIPAFCPFLDPRERDRDGFRELVLCAAR